MRRKSIFWAVFCFCCVWPAAANAAAPAWLAQAAQGQEQSLKARIGIAVLSADGRVVAQYRGAELFPLNSTHKVLLCAALLRAAEQNRLSLNDKTIFSKKDLVAYSPITEKLFGNGADSASADWRYLCSAAVSHSDNTAANLISAKMGGPAAITQFLREAGDRITRLDRYEPALNSAIPGDRRDTTAPLAISRTLRALLFTDIINAQSRQQLRQWMSDDAVADNLLRAALPQGWRIADKSGAGAHGSRSIIAAVWPQSGAPWLIAIYITATKAPMAQRDKAIARLGAVIFTEIEKMRQ